MEAWTCVACGTTGLASDERLLAAVGWQRDPDAPASASNAPAVCPRYATLARVAAERAEP